MSAGILKMARLACAVLAIGMMASTAFAQAPPQDPQSMMPVK